jgi:ferredoxin-type protein NapH
MNKKNLKIRRLILFSLVILSPVLFGLSSPIIMAFGAINGIITASAIIIVSYFILSLFLGRSASCGYTCPYGALQEVFGGQILKKNPPYRTEANWLRYFIFILFFGIIAFFKFTIGGNPRVDLFLSGGGVNYLFFNSFQVLILMGTSIIAIGFISIIFGSRAFCRYLCPPGVIFTIGTKIGETIKLPVLHLDSDEEKCTNCNVCNKSCPMGLEINGMIHNSSMRNVNCILCGECANICPKDAINYSFGKEKQY